MLWQWTIWSQGHLEPWVQNNRLLVDLIQTIGPRGRAMIDRSLGVLDLNAFPYVSDWLERCYTRLAAVSVRRKYAG